MSDEDERGDERREHVSTHRDALANEAFQRARMLGAMADQIEALAVNAAALSDDISFIHRDAHSERVWRRRFAIASTACAFVFTASLLAFLSLLSNVSTMTQTNRDCNTPGTECFNQRIEQTVDALGDEVGTRLEAVVTDLVIVLNNISEVVGIPEVREQIAESRE
jgi:hypothetical protein